MREASGPRVLQVVVGLALGGWAGIGSPSWALAQDRAQRFEPNQTRRAAARIEPGDHQGLYCDREDWYEVQVPAGKRLELSVTFSPVEGDLNLEVQDGRGRRLGWAERKSGGEEVVAVTPARPGPLFVRVHGGENRYALNAQLGAAPANLEGVNCWGSDWYEIELGAGLQLEAVLAFRHQVADLDLELFDETGENRLAEASGQGDEERLRYSVPEPRRLLLHVFNVHGARNVYSLRLTQEKPSRADLAEVFGETRPLAGEPDQVLLRRGDVLRGRVLDPSFVQATTHGDLRFPARRLAGIKLGPTGLATVVSVEEDSFLGFLRSPVLRVEVAGLGAPVELSRELVAEVRFARRGRERLGQGPPHRFQLLNGDSFGGTLLSAGGKLELDLGYAKIPLALDQLDSLMFDGDGSVTVLRRDQTAASGALSLSLLRVAVDTGSGSPVELELHPAALSLVYLTQSGDRSGLLQGPQLRLLVKSLAPQAPSDLLRTLAMGGQEERDGVLRQLRKYVSPGQQGSPMLRRHLLATEDLMERHAWLELMLRVDPELQDRVARVLGESNHGEGVRQAACWALCRLALEGGGYGALGKAVTYGREVSGDLMVSLAYSSNNNQLRNFIVSKLRPTNIMIRSSHRSDSVQQREALSKLLPEILR